MPTIYLRIKGKVQGVFYRVSAKEKADMLGLTGWVGNTPDGDVEAMAFGSGDALHTFEDWCRTGPPRAIVTSVNVTAVPDKSFGALGSFKAIRSSFYAIEYCVRLHTTNPNV